MRNGPKVTLQWFRSTLLIVGAVLIMCCAVFLYNLITLRSALYQTSDNLADYLKSSMDARLTDIMKASAAVELNTVNAELKKRSAPVDRVTIAMYRFGNYMDSFKTDKDAISNIFIYYPHLSYIVGSEGCYPVNSYFCLENGLKPDGLKRWISALEQTGSGYLFLPYGDTERFCYLRRMTAENEDVGTLVLELNTQELFDLKAVALHAPGGTLIGITLDGRTVYSGSDAFLQAWTKERGSDEPYTCVTRASSVSALTYVLLFDKPALLRPMTVSLFISIAGVLICFAVSLFASFALRRSHARPIKELMDCLGVTGGGKQNEFSTMQTRVEQLRNEHKSAQDELSQKQSSIDTLFLSYVLMGDLRSEEELDAAAARYRISFPHHHFRVGIISPASTAAKGRQDAIRQWFSQKNVCTLLIYQESQYILLFNIEKNTQLKTLTALLMNLEKELLPEGATAVLGHCYNCLSGISTSYCEALNALCYAVPNQITVYRSAQALLPASQQPASVWLTSLYACLKQKDYDSCIHQLDTGFDSYVSPGDTPAMCRVKLAALQNALLTFRQDSLDEGVLTESKFSTQDILRCTTSAELRELALSLLRHIRESRSSGQISAARRAQGIIRRSFTDPDLGLYLLADKLNVNNSYLSSTFKNEYGVGIMQYITSLRIEKAKKLLTTTSDSIKEIAAASGFSSDISFIRAFKRVTGTTPSALRKPQGE